MHLKRITALAALCLWVPLAVWAAGTGTPPQDVREQSGKQAIKQLPLGTKERLAQKIYTKQETALGKERSRQAPAIAKPAAKRTASVQKPAPSGGVELRQVPLESKDKQHKHKGQRYEQREFYANVMLPRNYREISIFGEPEVTKEQAVQYIRQNNPKVKLSCSIHELVDHYWKEAGREGVRPDLCICQAITETGFFGYGGDVIRYQNNFCGLGTVGKGVKGAIFKTPQLGVRAHVQHLIAYSRKTKPSLPIVDPRYKTAHALRLARGLVDKWYGLNGTWAMGSYYCEKIMTHFVRMQQVRVDGKNDRSKSMRERVEKYKNY